MPLRNLIRQDPSLTNITTEEDLVFLVEEVRTDLDRADSNAGIGREPLLDVIKYIEQGKYQTTSSQDEIDLSAVQDLLNTYKFFSEGGCQSCTQRVTFRINMDEGVEYFIKYEKEEDSMKDPT